MNQRERKAAATAARVRSASISRLLVAALFALVAAGQAVAQAPARVVYLAPGNAASTAARLIAFREGMRDNGLIEGRHYLFDVSYAEGDAARSPAMVREVLARKPALIMVSSVPMARAAQQATGTVPIVMMAINDPVESGLVASLARPGGNITGQSTQALDAMAKYVELLRETLPRARRIALLINPDNASTSKLVGQVRAASAGIEVRLFEAATPAALDATFAAIAQHRPDALLVLRDSMFISEYQRVSGFALNSRIPAFVPSSEFVDAGGLLSFAPSLNDMFRRSANFVKKILAGVKPADLPVEQPTRFELVINMKTAKTLGLTIPHTVLLRAERLVE